MKTSSAVLMAAAGMLAQQASAESGINIDSSKVDEDMAKDITSDFMQNAKTQEILVKSSKDFAEQVTIDGRKDAIDIEAFMAAIALDDSTGQWNQGQGDIWSYTNCHGACHGSRSWR